MFVNNTIVNGDKDSCSENFVIFAEKCPWESLLIEVTLCRVSIFFERSMYTCPIKYDFLEIHEIFNVTNNTNVGC